MSRRIGGRITKKMSHVRRLRLEDKEGIIERLQLHTKIDETTGCWLWIGSIGVKGYGCVRIEGTTYYVHRISCYIFHDLDLEDTDEQSLHKKECSNRNCWNPEHLYPGSYIDNIQDRLQDHCKRGHPVTIENSYFCCGKRYCKPCSDQTGKERREKIRAERSRSQTVNNSGQ